MRRIPVARSREHVYINDRNLAFPQPFSQFPCVLASGKNHTVLSFFGPFDRRLDLTGFVGMDHEGNLAFEDGFHGFPWRILDQFVGVSFFPFPVCLGLIEEFVDFANSFLSFPFLLFN